MEVYFLKKIIDFSTRNKLAIWLFTIVIVFAGLYVGSKMKMESTPNINIPVVTVVTADPGKDPTSIDNEITSDVVQKMMTLPGVDQVQSTSSENVSVVVATYDYDVNLDDAVSEAKEAVSKLDLPASAQSPTVSKINMNDMPIYTASISHDKKDMAQLTEYLNTTIIPSIEGVSGVSSVSIAGQQYNEVLLTFDEDKLTKYKLDRDTVKQLINASKVDMSLGMYTLDKEEVSVVVDGNVTTIKDLMNIKLPNSVDPSIKLNDIAQYVVQNKKDSISHTNGKDSISISVVKGQDANTVNVVEDIEDTFAELKKEDKNLNVNVTSEQATAIKDSVFTMLEKALYGALFAVIIIFIFLRSVKPTIISILSIPLSLIIAVLCVNSLGITLNIMTLGAMTVAIGRVIDDSIVVIENIYRRMGLKEKATKRELIINATKEVFVPICSSTIVTIAVFLPLGLVDGPIGEMFLPFALTMVFALLASLLVSITIVPMLAHSMFKYNVMDSDNSSVEEEKEIKHGKVSRGYRKILNACLNHKVISSFVAVLLLGGSLALAPVVGFSFMPSEEAETLTMTYETAVGETQDDSKKAALEAEKYLLSIDEVKTVEFSIGASSMMNLGVVSNDASFNIVFKKDTKNFDDILKKIKKEVKKFDSKGTWSVGFADMSQFSSNDLSLNLYGDSVDDIRASIEQIKKELKDNKNLGEVTSSLATPFTEYRFVVDKEKASQNGLTAAQVGMAISMYTANDSVTKVNVEGKEIDVFFEEKDKNDFDTLKDVMNKEITTPFGKTIKFKEIVSLEKGISPDELTKTDNKLYATVTAKIKTDDISKVTSEVTKSLDSIKFTEGVYYDFGGVSEQMVDSFSKLGMAILAAIAIVYIVLVLTFGSGAAPFAILFSLPFVIIGAIVGLYITGLTISATALVGVLMLVGIVVTNAIVLVDRIVHKQDEGIPTREAILEAAQTRLRPILMTAIATICALLPLAISGNSSSLISQDLAVTVIGGLTSSTILTLLFVPVVYEIVGKKRKKHED